jgi:hypothetical protein
MIRQVWQRLRVRWPVAARPMACPVCGQAVAPHAPRVMLRDGLPVHRECAVYRRGARRSPR